jgi:flagellar protein FliS
VFFLLGSKKGRLNINSLNLENYPSISIVVPAKNEENNIEDKFEYINRSIAIFDELRNILDFDGGDVAYYLDGLYLYQIETLFSAGVDNNLTAIAQVKKVVTGLIEAWKEETGL